MGRGDYSRVTGGQLKRGMMVLDIRGNAKKGSRLGSIPTGFGVEEEITKISPAYGRRSRNSIKGQFGQGEFGPAQLLVA